MCRGCHRYFVLFCVSTTSAADVVVDRQGAADVVSDVKGSFAGTQGSFATHACTISEEIVALDRQGAADVVSDVQGPVC